MLDLSRPEKEKAGAKKRQPNKDEEEEKNPLDDDSDQ